MKSYLVREAVWSLCLRLSLEQSLLCLHNVSLSVLKHILEASGIISGWSGRPFHGIVWHERAIWVGGRDHYPTRAEQTGKERELNVWGRARGFALTHTQHHSLYTNPYLIRLSFSAPSPFVYPSYVVLWEVEGGKGTVEGWLGITINKHGKGREGRAWRGLRGRRRISFH